MSKPLQQPKTELEKTKDPAEILNLYDIAEAKTPEELKTAVHKGGVKFDQYLQDYRFEELQEVTKKFLEHPEVELHKQLTSAFEEISKLTYIEKGNYLRSTVHITDQDYVLQLREQLITEYKAYSPSSKLIVDMAVNAYFRSLRASFNSVYLLQNKEGHILTLEQQRTNLLKELNKQIEMANRQFMTALTFLKELNQPPIKVSVQAKQAFVGQNQQFNKNA